jgi:hypothetical protein
MAIVYWPKVICPLNIAINAKAKTIGGPSALSGFVQNVATLAGSWNIRYEGIPVMSPERIMMWRALAGLIEGRSNQVIVPIFDIYKLTPLVSVPLAAASTSTYGDGSVQSDGTGFYTNKIQAVVTTFSPKGRTSLILNLFNCPDITPGQHFSINYRLYRITSIISKTSGATEVKIWPSLRDDVLPLSDVIFDDVVCKCRLATDNELDLTLEAGRWGKSAVNFIEDIS